MNRPIAAVIVGLQSGDEGKGRFTDVFSENAYAVVRWQGGPNTGHTVVVGSTEHRLIQIPSGVLRGCVGVIGNGCVVDPKALLSELEALRENGFDPKLVISPLAHVIFPFHKEEDALLDATRGASLAVSDSTGFRTGTGQIGTTRKGVGPCRSDKASRTGIRMIDLCNRDVLEARLRAIVPLKRVLLERVYGKEESNESVDVEIRNLVSEYTEYGQKLSSMLQDVGIFLADAHKRGDYVVYEGAQGQALDLDFGTYPYVSSGNSGALGVYAGTGTPPNTPLKIIGVTKAYMSQVGGGPLPSAMEGETEEYVVQRGKEFGTVTGRRRRVGWLDLPFLRRAVRLNGVAKMCITCLDVLAGLTEVRILTHYELNGQIIDEYPYDWTAATSLKPVYETFSGWSVTDYSAAVSLQDFTALPAELQRYVMYIACELDVEIIGLGVGRARADTIFPDADIRYPAAPACHDDQGATHV